MIRGMFLAATAAASLGLLPASASAANDERLLHHAFAENEVVRIDGRPGVQATIRFGENEAIENVAVGDSAAWQITPNKRADLLFVKPLENGARTNMTVVTDRHTYFFDLVASARTKPVYLLRFTYKDEPKKTGDASLAALTPAEQAAMGGDGVEAPVDPAALNFAWRPKGDTRILPARIYDDGNATYLLWGEKSEVPAILVLNAKGEEGPVNYSVRGRTIVVEDVPQTIVLRSGKAEATLRNERPASQPAAVRNAAATPTNPASAPPATPTAADPSGRSAQTAPVSPAANPAASAIPVTSLAPAREN